MTEDEMVEWHHQDNGNEFEQTQGNGEGQGSLVCCSPRGRKELDMAKRLNRTEGCGEKKKTKKKTLTYPISLLLNFSRLSLATCLLWGKCFLFKEHA